jgi:hypothetical protein
MAVIPAQAGIQSLFSDLLPFARTQGVRAAFARGPRGRCIKLANVLENYSELTPTAPEAGLMFMTFRGGAPDEPQVFWISYRREHDQPDL